MNNLSSKIKEICKCFGFIKTGFSETKVLIEESAFLKEWLAFKKNADMNWINKSYEKRINPSFFGKEFVSVISLAYLYNTPYKQISETKISRYAWNAGDYHSIISKKLNNVCCEIEKLDAEIKTLYFIDDAPFMDKVWAKKSGIGWQGKNTIVINKKFGSFFFIGNILINKKLDYDKPVENLCGKCRKCIEACPTGALYDDYKLDANLCIAYHTIENQKIIPRNVNLNGWIFGCDICQEVCPYNKTEIFTDDENFFPDERIYGKSISELENITEKKFDSIFKNSPIKRLGYKAWLRNIKLNKILKK
ncbi:MAG: tRNA epoxyqueuosine(34) reductase QueG [Ignavibacteria bacterium]|nr:tRNA epoxyqueuosine(34) reductase QueG [Ignavibacteria bacterium]